MNLYNLKKLIIISNTNRFISEINTNFKKQKNSIQQRTALKNNKHFNNNMAKAEKSYKIPLPASVKRHQHHVL